MKKKSRNFFQPFFDCTAYNHKQQTRFVYLFFIYFFSFFITSLSLFHFIVNTNMFNTASSLSTHNSNAFFKVKNFLTDHTLEFHQISLTHEKRKLQQRPLHRTS